MTLKEFLATDNVELIEKASACKSAAELQSLAKAYNVELTNGEVERIIAMFEGKTVTLSDNELDKVTGGYGDKNGKYPDKWGTYKCEPEIVKLGVFYQCLSCGSGYLASDDSMPYRRCEHIHGPAPK